MIARTVQHQHKVCPSRQEPRGASRLLVRRLVNEVPGFLPDGDVGDQVERLAGRAERALERVVVVGGDDQRRRRLEAAVAERGRS